MKVLDLFCGMGGWASTFVENCHDVTGIDIVDYSTIYPGKFIQADLLTFTPVGYYDLIVASPPCTDFSKASMPGSWTAPSRYPPDVENGLKLFRRTREIIDLLQPKYWVIENVRGAQRFVGKADFHIGSRYFWSSVDFKIFWKQGSGDVYGKYKMSPHRERPAMRSMIPYSIARALEEAIA
jgi:hypothetical protein